MTYSKVENLRNEYQEYMLKTWVGPSDHAYDQTEKICRLADLTSILDSTRMRQLTGMDQIRRQISRWLTNGYWSGRWVTTWKI